MTKRLCPIDTHIWRAEMAPNGIVKRCTHAVDRTSDSFVHDSRVCLACGAQQCEDRVIVQRTLLDKNERRTLIEKLAQQAARGE